MMGVASTATSTPVGSWVAPTVQAAVAGDEVAFARIVQAYHGDLIRVAFVVAGDEQLAQDAVQSAWSIAWRKLGSLRDPERLRPWLVSVAANQARQMVRSQNRRIVAEIKVRPAGDPPADPAGDPSTLVERLDLVAAFNHLKPEERSLLALRYLAGLDSTEISSLLGVSPTGVRSRLLRLLERLRKELRDG